MRVCILKVRCTLLAGISIVYLNLGKFLDEYTMRVCILGLEFLCENLIKKAHPLEKKDTLCLYEVDILFDAQFINFEKAFEVVDLFAKLAAAISVAHHHTLSIKFNEEASAFNIYALFDSFLT